MTLLFKPRAQNMNFILYSYTGQIHNQFTMHTASDPSVLIFWILKFLYFYDHKHPRNTVPAYFCSGGLYCFIILVFLKQFDFEKSQIALNHFIKQPFWHIVFTYTTSGYIIETYVQSLTI